MIFTVTWLPVAERQLAEIWLAAPDQAAVSLAANEIDRRLAVDPLREGESRDNDNRIIIARPLVVTYRVHRLDRLIPVTNARRIDPGPRRNT